MGELSGWLRKTIVGATLLSLVLVAGCGSGTDHPTTASGLGAAGEGGRAPGARVQAEEPRSDGSTGPTAAAKAEPARDGGRKRREEKSPARPANDHRSSNASSAEIEAARGCLDHFSRSTCAEMESRAEAPSTRVEKPSDCLKTMSKGECEKLLTSQQSAAADDDSVDLEKCLKNPTPKCEAALRPILEAQRGPRR
jgi:hypothetical protein